jgi:capsular polysaccharide transport system permease protein
MEEKNSKTETNKKFNLKIKFNTKYLKYLVFIILPIVIVAVYLTEIVQEKYESHASFLVKDLSSASSTNIQSMGLLGLGTSSQMQDSKIIEDYFLSLDILKLIDKEFNLSNHYKSEKTDILERLNQDATEERFLNLYRKNLVIYYDEQSSITHLSFFHNDKKIAFEILKFLLKSGENFLNNQNKKNSDKKLIFISEQVKQRKTELDEAISKVEDFQDKYKIIDPANEVSIQSSIIAHLESSLVEKNAEYRQLIKYVNKNSYEAKKLKSQINEIRKSLESTKKKLSGSNRKKLNSLMFEFERLKANVDFATEVYKSVLSQQEIIKVETIKESKILETISKPNLPDGYAKPNKIRFFITSVIVILLSFAIINLIIAVIKDHQD